MESFDFTMRNGSLVTECVLNFVATFVGYDGIHRSFVIPYETVEFYILLEVVKGQRLVGVHFVFK